MTAQIFSSAVNDDIRTERQRTLEIRCKESVVNDNELAVLLADLRYSFDIGYGKQRISGSLDIYRFNIIIDRFFNSLKIRCVYDLVSDVEVLEYIIKDSKSTAVDIV